jgi:hypothetical protein
MTTLIFGESFIGSFSLIKDNNLKLYKFKGATMKGLGKYDNKNRKKNNKFINSLNCNNCNKIIFAVYPSPIIDENVFNVLLAYGILSNNVVNSISNSDKKKYLILYLDTICI